jgi:hypothetical protein
MRGVKFIALVIFSIAPAAAGEFSENPAFCFGFISAQSQTETDALGHRKPQIRSLFAKLGPQDSTDERGFAEWERIGRSVAFERADNRHGTLLEDCMRLLDSAPD